LTFALTRSALDRPKQTIHAAELFHESARAIATICAEADVGDVVVAAVDRDDMVLTGVWSVSITEIARRVPDLEAGGWVLIFRPGTSVPQIEERCLQMARLAYARWEAMMKWSSRHA
jgi:hypothetical protein